MVTFFQKQYEKIALVVILTLYLVNVATFIIYGPIFEGPDEAKHYDYVRYLATTGRLPDPYTSESQFHQAPLYYVLLAPLATILPDEDYDELFRAFNPFYDPNAPHLNEPTNHNTNIYIHPPRWGQTDITVRLLRVFSALLGLGTLLIIYRIACRLFPEKFLYRVAVVAVAANWPQFVFLSSLINNDNLLYFWSTLSLLLMLVVLQASWTTQRAIALGMILGLALLTKSSAGFLVIPMVVLSVLTWLSDRGVWRYSVLCLATTVLVAGWWFVRSLVLYGVISEAEIMRETWSYFVLDPNGLRPDLGLERMPQAYNSLWARFGHQIIVVGETLQIIFAVISVGAVFGVGIHGVAWLWSRQVRIHSTGNLFSQSRVLILLVSFGLAWIGVLFYLSSSITVGNSGRFLLPSISVWAIAIVTGWGMLGRVLATLFRLLRRTQIERWLPVAVALMLMVACWWSLWGYFIPAYRPLSVPDGYNDTPLLIYYDQDNLPIAAILGVQQLQPVVQGGDHVEVIVYWEALNAAQTDLLVYFHAAFTPDVAWYDGYPGNGHLRSSDFVEGQRWGERYRVTIPQGAAEGTTYLITAGLYDWQNELLLPVFDRVGNRQPEAPVILTIEVQ